MLRQMQESMLCQVLHLRFTKPGIHKRLLIGSNDVCILMLCKFPPFVRPNVISKAPTEGLSFRQFHVFLSVCRFTRWRMWLSRRPTPRDRATGFWRNPSTASNTPPGSSSPPPTRSACDYTRFVRPRGGHRMTILSMMMKSDVPHTFQNSILLTMER